MPLHQMLSTQSPELTAFLVETFWILAVFCGVVAGFTLVFIGVASRTVSRHELVLPECHQFGTSVVRPAGAR